MATSNSSRPCPSCGGNDRYVYIAQPRDGRSPFWYCTHRCGMFEAVSPNARRPNSRPPLKAKQRAQAYRGYTAAALWCQGELWQPGGAQALAYLHARGLTDETIRAARIGWHFDHWCDGLGPALYKQNRAAYTGARLGGLLGPQGKPKNMLRGAITLPYWRADECRMVRTRMLDPGTSPKYQAPAGVGYYAGGEPCFYLDDVIDQVDALILTEGEFKALAVWQAWRAKQLSVPAVAQPGIGFLPDALLDRLAGKTVYLCYDSEMRRDPFQPSPG